MKTADCKVDGVPSTHATKGEELTAALFLEKFKSQIALHQSGRITDFRGTASSDREPLLVALRNLPDQEFEEIAAKMIEKVKKRYLYHSYPVLFATIDDGSGFGDPLDGELYETERDNQGGNAAVAEKLKNALSLRDRKLFASVSWATKLGVVYFVPYEKLDRAADIVLRKSVEPSKAEYNPRAANHMSGAFVDKKPVP